MAVLSDPQGPTFGIVTMAGREEHVGSSKSQDPRTETPDLSRFSGL